MAIGSEGEIGATFAMWKDMTEEDRKAWWKYMDDNWNPYLMNGYATLVHHKNNPHYQQYVSTTELQDITAERDVLKAKVHELHTEVERLSRELARG